MLGLRPLLCPNSGSGGGCWRGRTLARGAAWPRRLRRVVAAAHLGPADRGHLAKSWAEREHRVTPFSSAAFGEGPTVGPERFNSSGEHNTGAWRALPPSWPALPEGEVLSAEALDVARQALTHLPDAQRAVIALRRFSTGTTHPRSAKRWG